MESVIDAQNAAQRALCLAAMELRLALENQAQMSAPERELVEGKPWDLPAGNAELIDWLKQEGLWPKVSAAEQKLLTQAVGQWQEQDCLDISWREEALGVIEWALQWRKNLLPYDEQYDHGTETVELPVFKPVKAFLTQAQLRPAQEILDAREVAELWLWRARTRQLQQEPNPPALPPDWTYEKIITVTAEKSTEAGFFTAVDQDFPAFGKAYARATEEEASILQSIALERLYALNWLCGYAADWDAVSTDT